VLVPISISLLVCRTVSETFSVKERRDLEIGGYGSFKVIENGAVR